MSSRKYDVTPEQFCEAWTRAGTVQEAAERLGMPPAIASARASVYRKLGIRLKHMPKPRRLDVEGLKALAERLKGLGGDGRESRENQG